MTTDNLKVKLCLCVVDKSDESPPIVGAHVWGRTKKKTASQARKSDQFIDSRDPSVSLNDTTGADGCVVFDVMPDDYEFYCDAFGTESQISIPLRNPRNDALCEVKKYLRIPVGFHVVVKVIKEDCQEPEDCISNITTEGSTLIWAAIHNLTPDQLKKNPIRFIWNASNGRFLESPDLRNSDKVHLNTNDCAGDLVVDATLSEIGSTFIKRATKISIIPRQSNKFDGNVNVTMRRAGAEPTNDLPLWVVIRKSTEAISFSNYFRFINHILCGEPLSEDFNEYERSMIPGKIEQFNNLRQRRFLPLTDADAYRILKVATEAFLMVNCGVFLQGFPFLQEDADYVSRRVGVTPDLSKLWQNYLKHINGTTSRMLPYMALIRDKLRDVRLIEAFFTDSDNEISTRECFGVLTRKLTQPCLLELLWSYWMEEGMLVQTVSSIARRFQNLGYPTQKDPLANLEIDPLRPLNNMIWGYIQDEQHRLTVIRRAYEYDHHYGLRLEGKAVPEMHSADSRSKFLEAFHNLLHLCTFFFHQDDDTTVVADGFPLLNGLQEVHLILSQGAHNQFGDLPSTARIEMLMQQWLLARPEFREFLPTRIMVAYPEPWMDRVDAMKKLQDWTDTSIMHFRNLAVYGEQILLSIRYGAWSDVNDPAQAANWARFWRPEIQGYIHAYRSVTGADLTLKEVPVDIVLPSVHLKKRLALQHQKKAHPRAYA